MDAKVLGFTALISVVASVLFGLFPAIRYGSPNMVSALKEGGRGGSPGKERHVARNALVVAQMAMALILLAGSGLMIRSFQALLAVEPGFTAPEEVLTFRLTIPTAEVEGQREMAMVHQQILDQVAAIPGVISASMSSSVSMDGNDSNDPVEAEGFPLEPNQIPPIRRFKWIGENYFETMGNPVLAGRSLTRADAQDLANVAVTTENFAREYWGEPRAAVGKRIRVALGEMGEGAWREVVGVVGNVYDDGVAKDAPSIVYWPQVANDFYSDGINSPQSMAYAVRTTTGNPTALLGQVRDAVWSVNRNLPIARVRTMKEFVDEPMASTSFTLIMLGLAAFVALFLGSVGIYGVISYVVAQRTREIGVRMALGAERSVVSRMVLKQALMLAGGGVAIGLLGALGLTRLMSSLLFGVSPLDPLTFASVAAALSAVALVASYLPARRASLVDPLVALRAE
jgi:predicted permease